MKFLVLFLILSSCAALRPFRLPAAESGNQGISKDNPFEVIEVSKPQYLSGLKATYFPIVPLPHGDELRVGFIDLGKIESFDQFKEFPSVEFFQNGPSPEISAEDTTGVSSKVKEQHAKQVIYSFLSNLKTKRSVKIYSCSYESNVPTSSFLSCLVWMKKNKILALNLPSGVMRMDLQAKNALESEIDRRVIVSVSAGNEAQEAAGLCTFEGVFCVGANHLGKRTRYSNFGRLVNTWEEDDLTWGDIHPFGTSYSAPRFLAKKLSNK